jgi:adenylate cyclase
LTRSARRSLLHGFAIAVAVTVLIGTASLLGVLATLRVRATDVFFNARPVRPARATAIVAVDDRSHRILRERHGAMSAWPRAVYADALRSLARARPRVIGLAIFFDTAKPGDDALAEAIRDAGNVVTPAIAEKPRTVEVDAASAQDFDALVRTVPSLRADAVGEGVVNVTSGRDGVVRRLPLIVRVDGADVPSLALAVVARFTRRPVVLDGPARPGRVDAAGRRIPVEDGATMTINYLGPPFAGDRAGPFAVVPLIDVIEGRFDPVLVRDRIVLLGVTIPGVAEHPTPTTGARRMPGVEVLGHAIETILDQRYLVPVSPGASMTTIVVLALAGAGLVAVLRPFAAGAAVLTALALYLVAAGLFFDGGTVLDLVYPPAALVTAFGLALTDRLVFEQAQQRLVREAMGRYLSPAVSRWLLEDPDRLVLAGELREMTVLFTDLRGFTTVTHALPPQTVVALLNEYRTAMTEIVFRHDGVLAQFVGDAIEVFWNAPMDQPDHARRACDTALDMIASVRELGPGFARRGWPGLAMGVGINTGALIVGNMGSEQRFAYTAVGDPVNVAARLEALTKEYRVDMVVGDATRLAAGDAFAYRFLDVVVVPGRPEPLQVWEIIGRNEEVDTATAEFLRAYQRGIVLYRSREWEEAASVFATLVADRPGDQPSALYRRRSLDLLEHPPPSGWNGVYVSRVK